MNSILTTNNKSTATTKVVTMGIRTAYPEVLRAYEEAAAEEGIITSSKGLVFTKKVRARI